MFLINKIIYNNRKFILVMNICMDLNDYNIELLEIILCKYIL